MPASPAKPVDENEAQQYVVVANAITLDTGQRLPNGKPVVRRMLKGALLTAPANHPTVIQFLSLKSIALYAKDKAYRPVTARQVCAAMGAVGDPVQAPLASATPLAASVASATI